MFKKYMDLAKINKIIAIQRKIAKTQPESGYSAIISAMLENEAKGTFKSYPEYTRKVVNDFFAESVENFRKTDVFNQSLGGQDSSTVSNDQAVFIAVLLQAVICKNLSMQELIDDANDSDDNDNMIKVLVNLKLLPERCLNDCKFDMRVA